jgi:hypothetical protein
MVCFVDQGVVTCQSENCEYVSQGQYGLASAAKGSARQVNTPLVVGALYCQCESERSVSSYGRGLGVRCARRTLKQLIGCDSPIKVGFERTHYLQLIVEVDATSANLFDVSCHPSVQYLPLGNGSICKDVHYM